MSRAKQQKQVEEHKVPRACDSIWIFFQGKSIRLAFLSFGTESELKRVCQNIYKYNNPGQLSDTNGYKINEMKDGSRVVVVRLRNFRKNNKDAKAYYSTDFSFGVGYDIIASTLDLTKESNRVLVNSTNSKFITDEIEESKKL